MNKGGCQELLHMSGKEVKEKANFVFVFVVIFCCLGRTQTYS